MVEYSNSQIGVYETCPRQYKLIYIDRIKRYEEGVEAFLGQRFHEAMERLYAERACRIVPLDELLAYFETVWAEKWHSGVKIKKEGRTPDDYRLMGRRFIEDYYRRHHPFEEGRILGLERYIRFPLDEAGRYRFKGIIDRLIQAGDGAFEVHDYKTGSKLPEQAEVDEDRQLALYQIGVQTLWPQARDVRLVWHMVAFDLEMRSARTPEALEALKADVMRLIDEIEATTEFAPSESALCDWCCYWDLCPARKHLVKVEALPADEWKDEPGVKIVDAFAELTARKKSLEEQIEPLDEELGKLRDAAIAFSEREGVSLIAGTEARLRVSKKDRVVSPAKGSDEREALERELKALGVWDEVATLDPCALERAVAEGRWSGSVLDRLKAYIGAERRYTVTMAKKAPGCGPDPD